MAAVPCAECNHLVAPSASGCGRCGAPIWVAIPPPPPEEPPPATNGTLIVGSAIALSAIVGLFAFALPGKGGKLAPSYPSWSGPLRVPEFPNPVGETLSIPPCGYDWRACADNRDWIETGHWAGAREACLALAMGATRYGRIALDGSRSRPRFDIYVSGASVRQGYIVFVDDGGLILDGSGGWVRTPLHCTFDLVAWEARTLAPP